MLYYHVGKKDDLYLAVLEGAYEQIRVEERRAVCPAGRANTQCSRVEDKKSGRVKYRFEWTTHCAQCPLRAKCLEPDQSHRRLEVGRQRAGKNARHVD